MNNAEKVLLQSLKEKNKDAPLEGIRNSIGELRYFVGNPKFKAEVSLIVTTQFIHQVIAPPAINVILPGALPANLQTQLPFFIFGLTDFFGCFNKSISLFPVADWFYVWVGILDQWWFNLFTAANPVNLQIGDLVMVFEFNVNVPVTDVYLCFVSVHCNNVSYGTFLHSFASDIIVLNMLRYTVPAANVNQLINPLVFSYQTLFGKFKTDTVDPRTYITSATFQQQISDIPISLPIDKYLMLGSYLDIFCQRIDFILSVAKVQPLQLKPY